jgi:NADP-dependent 3-hydroxy acid dehydrogenase YdfG
MSESTEDLIGTVALVTGASSGIGEATARTLARAGATVALVARRRARLEALADDLGGTGAKTLVLEADITDPDQASGVVEQAVADLGRLDTVVNVAHSPRRCARKSPAAICGSRWSSRGRSRPS